jgi:hypothetical protein
VCFKVIAAAHAHAHQQTSITPFAAFSIRRANPPVCCHTGVQTHLLAAVQACLLCTDRRRWRAQGRNGSTMQGSWVCAGTTVWSVTCIHQLGGIAHWRWCWPTSCFAPAACLPDCQTLRYLISAASLPGFKTKHVTINVMTRLFRNPRPCCAGARGGRVAQERGTAYQITDVDSECSLTMSVIYIQLLIKNGWLKSAMCLTLFQPLLLGLG